MYTKRDRFYGLAAIVAAFFVGLLFTIIIACALLVKAQHRPHAHGAVRGAAMIPVEQCFDALSRH